MPAGDKVGNLWIGDNGGDADPINPQPKSHYGRFQDSPWYYVNDELAQTFILRPTTDAEPGDDWIPSFTEEGATEMDRERVCVRLTSRALHGLYIEMGDLLPSARQAGCTAGYDLRGESAPLEKTTPGKHKGPIHRCYYAGTYDEPVWMEGYRAEFNQQSGVLIGWYRLKV